MALDAHAIAHLEDHLISGLQFKSSSGASNYVTASRYVTFNPEGGSMWNTSDRTLRFRLADSFFIDLQSLRLAYTLHNTSFTNSTNVGRPITPLLGGPMAIFSTCRRFLAGALVEDISERHSCMHA